MIRESSAIGPESGSRRVGAELLHPFAQNILMNVQVTAGSHHRPPRSRTSLTASILNSRLNFRPSSPTCGFHETPNLGVHYTRSSSRLHHLAKRDRPSSYLMSDTSLRSDFRTSLLAVAPSTRRFRVLGPTHLGCAPLKTHVLRSPGAGHRRRSCKPVIFAACRATFACTPIQGISDGSGPK